MLSLSSLKLSTAEEIFDSKPLIFSSTLLVSSSYLSSFAIVLMGASSTFSVTFSCSALVSFSDSSLLIAIEHRAFKFVERTLFIASNLTSSPSTLCSTCSILEEVDAIRSVTCSSSLASAAWIC